MKKIALALLCVFATGSAAAQTYACQFIMTAGMDKELSGWKTKTFNSPEPFFLTMSEGLIDTKSFSDRPIRMSKIVTSCSKSPFDSPPEGYIHFCADDTKYLSFSETTLNGGLARTFGALQPSSESEPDSVSISRFKCQKVR